MHRCGKFEIRLTNGLIAINTDSQIRGQFHDIGHSN